MIYRLLRALLRHSLAVFFRKVEIQGLEALPQSGPLLIAANHPNTLIDVLLVATRLERKVGFVAKATLFKNPIMGPFFRFLGAIPIHRRQDGVAGADAQAANASALSSCVDHVAAGGAILIFPEGISQHQPRLQKLKTGLARIALAAEKRVPGTVVIAPVALVYEDAETFRSRARITFAAPLCAAPFAELSQAEDDSFVGVRALTEAVRQSLLPELVHVDDSELDTLASRVDALYGRSVEEQAGGRLAATAVLTNALNAFAAKQPERVEALKTQLNDYDASLATAGIDDGVIRDHPRAPSVVADLGLVLGAPLALWGALNHLVLYQIPRAVLRFVPSDPVETATTKLLTGLLGLIATYTVQGYLAFELAKEMAVSLSPWTPTLVYVGTLPIFGLLALVWLEALTARRTRRHALSRRKTLEPDRLATLVSQRSALMTQLDSARADYLAGQLDPSDAEADEPW